MFIRFTAILGAWLVSTPAATFHCDPAVGTEKGDGSTARPWRTIQEVLEKGLIQLPASDGKVSHPDAPVKAGDTILLASGWHGILRINSGFNDQPITIAAAPRATPQIGWAEIRAGKNWIIRGLTISPSLAPAALVSIPRNLVTLGEGAGDDSSNLVIEDCFIFSVLDSAIWTAGDWVRKAHSGIFLGRHGRRHIARNNYVLNTRFGIQLCAPDCIAEGNIVANFSADGMRVTRDGQLAQYNVIKNNFVSARDGDDNHDDGIQAFLFNAGTGTLRDITLRGNIVISREKEGLPFPNGLQGIGFFDGPLVNFLVESNVVHVNHSHGISLYDAQNCLIQDNTCYSPNPQRARPWIMLGQKKNQAATNTVRRNSAFSFQFKADPAVKAENNQQTTEEIFHKKLSALDALINEKFGRVHLVAQRPRLEFPSEP